ncbi:heme utilization protein HutZ [Shewanella sp. SNU WT4]|uniref:heme utilization protein HutZ n=1 Tax=Shewanella sp. SNU WT4 TaxID=2590015 RepID=UPI00112E6A13|nr:heme utilization protein HutZ [Shewanella sp. SNU WT4]QDF66162.1 heme utilization protein HutZ [Shewanella sp. SNU WT4]
MTTRIEQRIDEQQAENHTQERLASKLLPEINQFKHSRHTLQLATCDQHGLPNASYAPYALADKGFYILVSDMARHGMNLKQSSLVSVMLLEDESEAKTVFARKRLTFDAHAKCIGRDNPDFNLGVAALTARFGDMIAELAALADFNLYQLRPQQGLYVKGFGQAFKLSGDELLEVSWQNAGQHGVAQPLSPA